MNKGESSRRLFLTRSFAGLSAAWLFEKWPEILAAQEHAHRRALGAGPAKFEFFTPQQSVEVEAIAAQIIPADETAGAREAHVIYFIDRALASFDKDKQPLYAKGLDQIEARARRLKAKHFSELTPERQTGLLKGIQLTEFFSLIRTHTIMGYFANPEYGGNLNQAGWQAIGFEDHFFFKPPFGFYDRDYKEGK
jgi:gluconate 2-dehydrogenase gamma chain